MRIVDNRVRTEVILDKAITKVKAADEVIIRDTITVAQDGSAQTGAKGYMPFAGDIVACAFINDSGAVFSAAAKIAVTAGDVCSSSATLADGTSERISTGLTNNTRGWPKGLKSP